MAAAASPRRFGGRSRAGRVTLRQSDVFDAEASALGLERVAVHRAYIVDAF